MTAILGVLFALLAAVGLATQAIFVRMGVHEGDPSVALVVVLLVDSFLFVPYAGVVHYPDYGLTAWSLTLFVIAGLLSMGIGRALLYKGIKRVGASRSEPLKATQAVPATLGSVLLLGESVTLGHILGVLLIIAGVAIISLGSIPRNGVSTGKNGRWVGILLVLGAAVCFGIDAVVAKAGFTTGTPVFVAIAVKMIAGTAGFFTYLWWRNAVPTTVDLRKSSVKWFVAAGVSSAVFLFGFYAGLEVAPVVIVVPIMQTSPLIVAAISYMFLQRLERVTWRLVSGAALVIAGAVGVTVFG